MDTIIYYIIERTALSPLKHLYRALDNLSAWRLLTEIPILLHVAHTIVSIRAQLFSKTTIIIAHKHTFKKTRVTLYPKDQKVCKSHHRRT